MSSDEHYLIGAGKDSTGQELTERLLDLCGIDESGVASSGEHLRHDRRYSIDASKLARLGWGPRRRLDERRAATGRYRPDYWWCGAAVKQAG